MQLIWLLWITWCSYYFNVHASLLVFFWFLSFFFISLYYYYDSSWCCFYYCCCLSWGLRLILSQGIYIYIYMCVCVGECVCMYVWFVKWPHTCLIDHFYTQFYYLRIAQGFMLTEHFSDARKGYLKLMILD